MVEFIQIGIADGGGLEQIFASLRRKDRISDKESLDDSSQY